MYNYKKNKFLFLNSFCKSLKMIFIENIGFRGALQKTYFLLQFNR